MNPSAISLLTAQNIYMMATQCAMKVFELSCHLPPEDVDTLRSLIIDSSSKVCTQLNQAWQNRECEEVFTTSIKIARIEAKKTMKYVESARKAKYIEAQTCENLKAAYSILARQISEIIQGSQ